MNKKNVYLISIIVLLFIFSILFFYFMNNNEIKKVCINNNCFNVELALTREQKIQGLMNRESLTKDSGMLFIYNNEGYYSFWMKNMNFPIDIIWINKNKEIVHIEKNLPPCAENKCPSYKSSQKAMYILEIGAGLTDKLNIKTSDKISLE